VSNWISQFPPIITPHITYFQCFHSQIRNCYRQSAYSLKKVGEWFLFIVPDVETIDKEELNNFIAERVSWDPHTSFFYFFERHFFYCVSSPSFTSIIFALPNALRYYTVIARR
jgi:hypothetical protein